MQWASALASDEHLSCAFDGAADELIRQLSVPPQLLVAFISHAYGAELERIPEMVAAAFPGCLLVGCAASGVLGAGRELENRPAVSLLAGVLPDVVLSPFHWTDLVANKPRPATASGTDSSPAQRWQHEIGISPSDEPSFLVLADPFSTDSESMLQGLDAAYPNACKVGGLLSGVQAPGEATLFLGTECHHEGVVAIALRGDISLDSIVAQGCRPVGEPLILTRFTEQTLLEFNRGRPVDVLRELYSTLEPHDQGLLEHSLFVGLELPTGASLLSKGEFIMRPPLGFDPEAGTMTVHGPLESHQVVQFHVRDKKSSSDDLDAVLAGYAETQPSEPSAALMVSCVGRGAHFYGTSEHDSRAFLTRFGEVPMGGFFANGEIGTVGKSGTQQTFVHGYSSAFAIIRPK